MRAAVVTEPGDPDVFAIRELPDPEPGPEDVLVAVHATALNRADLMQRRGGYPAPPGIRQDVPGLEMAGIVERVGARDHGLLGQRELKEFLQRPRLEDPSPVEGPEERGRKGPLIGEGRRAGATDQLGSHV